MTVQSFNSKNAPSSAGNYSQAIRLTDFSEVVFVSGQIPVAVNDEVPTEFDAQCHLVWANVEAQLKETGLSLSNIIKVTTYLSSREFNEINSRIRREILGNLQPALTVIMAGIYDPAWLLEIEVIAAA
jgi:2-iminobutanoate/2-iminopropanoate deaminase